MREDRIRTACALRVGLLLVAAMVLLAGCGGHSDADPYAEREPVDLRGYESMEEYGGEIALVETDVAEIISLMDQRKTFVFFAGYKDCPWCNRLLPYLNEAALAAGRKIGYLDTRKDPSWQNNADVEGYDLLLERFGEYFDLDESGEPHFYVPDTYFIRDGAVVARHDGVVEGADDPEPPLTGEQEARLRELLEEEFKTLGG